MTGGLLYLRDHVWWRPIFEVENIRSSTDDDKLLSNETNGCLGEKLSDSVLQTSAEKDLVEGKLAERHKYMRFLVATKT